MTAETTYYNTGRNAATAGFDRMPDENRGIILRIYKTSPASCQPPQKNVQVAI